MPNKAGWFYSRNILPKENEQVVVLDYTHKDILLSWAVFKEGQFYLLIGANIGIPEYWRRDVQLPEIVLNTIKEN